MDASDKTRISLWSKKALRVAKEEKIPIEPTVNATPSAISAVAEKKQKSPLGAGRAFFGADVKPPENQGAGKIIFEAPTRRATGGGIDGTQLGRTVDGFFRPKTVVQEREKFMTTEAGQYLKLQKEHMENSAVSAERQRMSQELARAESIMFIKQQELQRIEIRQRSIEASARAATLNANRAKSERDTAAAAARDRSDERSRLESNLEVSEQDFDRRVLTEKKGLESVGREISQLTNRGWGNAPEIGNLKTRKVNHERGSSSIEHERTRRRSESNSKIVKVSREVELQKSRLRRAERDFAVASSLLERYRMQAQTLKASRATIESEVERSRREVERLRASIKQLPS